MYVYGSSLTGAYRSRRANSVGRRAIEVKRVRGRRSVLVVVDGAVTVLLSDAVAVGHAIEQDTSAKVVAGEGSRRPCVILRATIGSTEI